MTVIRFPAHEAQTMRQRVSENIKVLMARRGIRQPQIMAILGMSQPPVSRRMNGQFPWNIDELELIAAAFEVSVTELMTGESPTPEGTLTREYLIAA